MAVSTLNDFGQRLFTFLKLRGGGLIYSVFHINWDWFKSGEWCRTGFWSFAELPVSDTQNTACSAFHGRKSDSHEDPSIACYSKILQNSELT